MTAKPSRGKIIVGGMDKKEYLFKVLVVGECETGKTSVITQYVHRKFENNYKATIGVDFALKVIHRDKKCLVRLQLWDVAGQERYGNMTRVYYKEAVGAFVVFDITRMSTFDAVQKWKADIDEKVTFPGGQNIPVVLLANKCDLIEEGFVASHLDRYCEERGFLGWFETSAKENINIEESANLLVDEIIKIQERQEIYNGADSDNVLLTPHVEQSKGCKC